MTAAEVVLASELTEQDVRTLCHGADEWWRSCAAAAPMRHGSSPSAAPMSGVVHTRHHPMSGIARVSSSVVSLSRRHPMRSRSSRSAGPVGAMTTPTGPKREG